MEKRKREPLTANDLPAELRLAYQQAQAQYAEAEVKRQQYNNWLIPINLVIRTLVFFALNMAGFLIINNPKTEVDNTVSLLLVCAVLSIAFLAVKRIAEFLFGSFVVLTCCMGLILAPVYYAVVNWLVLLALQRVIPDIVNLPENYWLGLLVGLIIYFQIPEIAKPSEPKIVSPDGTDTSSVSISF